MKESSGGYRQKNSLYRLGKNWGRGSYKQASQTEQGTGGGVFSVEFTRMDPFYFVCLVFCLFQLAKGYFQGVKRKKDWQGRKGRNQDLFLGFFCFFSFLLSESSLRDRSFYDIAGLVFAFFSGLFLANLGWNCYVC